MAEPTTAILVRVVVPLREAIEARAKAADRSVAQEVRHLLTREYLAPAQDVCQAEPPR